MTEGLGKSHWKRRKSEPKSVLGFFAIVLGILLSATVGAVGVLAWTNRPIELIVAVLLFGGGFLVLVVFGVFVVMIRDPSKLMLTHVTGDEFIAIQTYHTLGDSISGTEEQKAREVTHESIELIAMSIHPSDSDEPQVELTADVREIAETRDAD